MRLFKTPRGAVVENRSSYFRLPGDEWDEWICQENLGEELAARVKNLTAVDQSALEQDGLLAPIGSQEVWAAGVTYFRSRTARMEEAQATGGGDFYDRVYEADRPELFFKANPHRVAGPGQKIRIRKDSKWNVPEPELVLVISPNAKTIGYTIGNDVSSRQIEGENPLYLPQAKIYDHSCALGPGILVSHDALSPETSIEMTILRNRATLFAGSTTLASMKRSARCLIDYLYRETSFPKGCFLLTGTGIVPPDEFTLRSGDEVSITIAPIGTLVNVVE